MDERYKDPSAYIDETLERCHGSGIGWEASGDYVYWRSQSGMSNAAEPGLALRGSIPLPTAFVSMYDQVRYKSFMGLFPQINRAWLTVDTRLFLWSYSPNSMKPNLHSIHPLAQNTSLSDDFISFEGFDQVIVAVELVHPRPGVFPEEVQYLLAVATSVDVTLLAVTFSGPNCTGDITLTHTGYSVATDNVLMVKMCSSPDGRIFMAGVDGFLHEFVYRGEESRWILGLLAGNAKKAQKNVYKRGMLMNYFISAPLASLFAREDELVDLVIDSQRKALYTLSQNGILSVYSMPSADKLACIRSVNVAHDSRNIVSLSIPAAEREYVAMFPVPPSVSDDIHLVVVTSFGERLYFSTKPTSMPRLTNDDNTPKTLLCIGYRPTPITNPLGATRPCVHMAWWSKGCLVMADLRDSASDRLFSVFPDQRLARRNSNGTSANSVEVVYESPTLNENSTHDAPSFQSEHVRTFAIGHFRDLGTEKTNSQVKVPFDPPQLFWVLTSRHLHLYERIEPVEKLVEILSSSIGSIADIRSIFNGYESDELCAMCLKIAITNPVLSPSAAQMFYGLGESPSILNNSQDGGWPGSQPLNTSASHDNPRVTRNGTENTDYERPQNSGSFSIGRPAMQISSTATFSDVHKGTCLYISQIVYPLWQAFTTTSRDANGYHGLAYPKSILGNVRDRLLGLVSFFENYNPEIMLPASKNSSRPDEGNQEPKFSGPGAMNMSDVHLSEAASIGSLKDLSSRCAQAISLLLLLSEHQLHRLAPTLAEEMKVVLSKLRLRELVVTRDGEKLAQALLNALFSCFPENSYPKVQIINILRDKCPMYYGTADESLHHGLSLLREAARRTKEANGMAETPEETTVMPAWTVENINKRDIMSAEREGILREVENAAESLKNAVDRIFNFDEIFNLFTVVNAPRAYIDLAITIGQFHERKGSLGIANSAYSTALNPLHPLIHQPSDVSNRDDNFPMESAQIEKRGLKDACLQTALTATSTEFLKMFFEFLVRSSSGELELLKLRSKDVEGFLTERNDPALLWRYYSHHGRYLDAAVILWRLADEEREKDLGERMSNLSVALHNAQAAARGNDPRAEPLVAEISDFMDVAKVQFRVLTELRRGKDESPEAKEALVKLNDRIMDLSTLYNDFAKPLDLFEGSLEALRCGSYRDDTQVQIIWMKMLRREAESNSHVPSRVAQRILEIGKCFYPCSIVFPVKFIVDLLERYAFERMKTSAWVPDSGWVSRLMIAVGVPLGEIISAYQSMMENQLVRSGIFTEDWAWTDDVAQLHLIEVTAFSLRTWVDRTASREGVVSLGEHYRRGWLSEREKALRAVASCKSRLRANTKSAQTNTKVANLLRSFDTIEQDLGQ